MEKSCPNEEMIADYIEEHLSNKQKHIMEKHLSVCDHCLVDFQVARNLFSEKETIALEGVPARVTQAAIDLINSRIAAQSGAKKDRLGQFMDGLYLKICDSFIWTSGGKWQLAPVRGSGKVLSQDIIRIKKAFKGVKAEIEIEKLSGNKADIRVKLFKVDSVRPGIRVTLKRDEREILSHPIGVQGYVLFDEIPFGRYRLVFGRNRIEIGQYCFDMKESNNG